jgi:hypothetical protein
MKKIKMFHSRVLMSSGGIEPPAPSVDSKARRKTEVEAKTMVHDSVNKAWAQSISFLEVSQVFR